MDHTCWLLKIKSALTPSTGCTEPAAIALNAATARAHVQGEVTRIVARLDPYLFKNAMGVGIPGADERGVDLCVALGVTAGAVTMLCRVWWRIDGAAIGVLAAAMLTPVLHVSYHGLCRFGRFLMQKFAKSAK